jgi:hypothetical protein
LTDDPAIDAAATAAFRALQAKARAEHAGNTQPLLVVYAVESFLRRLAISEQAQQMVLKGGMLMAANDIRRFTKDADLSTHGITNDKDRVRQLVEGIASLAPEPHDGVTIDPAAIKTEIMREDDEYHGVRCKLTAALGRARIAFALDFSFGDPGSPTTITLNSVIDRPPVRLAAYPLALNLAEKIVTAMQRGETSTRDRDFADLWVAGRRHRIDAAELRGHVFAVAAHREQPIVKLGQALAQMPDRQKPYRAMIARMAYTSSPPERWDDCIAGVVAFVDPLLEDRDGSFSHWEPDRMKWTQRVASPEGESYAARRRLRETRGLGQRRSGGRDR